MSDEGEDLNALWSRARKGDHTARGRRARELKSLPPSARRQMRAEETKTAQLNVRITPTVRAQIAALALAERQSIAEFIERLVHEFAQGKGE